MKITDILDKAHVVVPLAATDKTAAIAELVEVLAHSDKITDKKAVLEAVTAREQTRSTGIGEGLAVPHGKCHGCSKLALAIGKPRVPIDFGSKDGRPCEVIFLLASPVDEMGPHIQALARISRTWLVPEIREAVGNAKTPEEVYAVIQRHEG